MRHESVGRPAFHDEKKPEEGEDPALMLVELGYTPAQARDIWAYAVEEEHD